MIKVDTGNMRKPRFISPGTEAFYAGDFPGTEASCAKALALQSIVEGVEAVLALALISPSGSARIEEEVLRVWQETEATVHRFGGASAAKKASSKVTAALTSAQ